MSKQGTRHKTRPGQSNGTTEKAVATQAKPVAPTVKASSSATAKPSQPDLASKPAQKPGSKQQRRQQKIETRRVEHQRVAKSRNITYILVAAAVVVAAGLLVFFYIQGQSATPGVVDANFAAVDGITCDSNEQLVYHIHAHLEIYVNGLPISLPQYIGIADPTAAAGPTCYYWLHTHDTTGVIHIESPTQKIYTLQNFLDIWQSFTTQQISFPTELASSTGWTIYVNGKQVTGNFSSIGLTAHELVTISYNSPGIKPLTTYSWGQL